MAYEKFMAAAVIAAACSACAHLPPAPEARGVSVEDLVKSIKCELGAAAAVPKLKGRLKNYLANATLELKLVDSNQLGASAVMVIPNAPETITGAFGATLGGSSTRKTTVAYVLDLAEIQKAPTCDTQKTGLPGAPISLGLDEWLRSSFLAIDGTKTVVPPESTYQLEFILTARGDGSISVVAYRITNATAGGFLSRQDTHTLTVAIAPKAAEPGPTKIEIANWPAGSVIPRGEWRSQGSSSPANPTPLSGTVFGPTLDRLDMLIRREQLKRITIEQ